jgi:copper chaperone
MIRLRIEGMTCEHCVRTVQETLSKLPGVDRVAEVSLERGEALVSGEPETAALVAALHEEGFEARVE